MSYAVRGVSGDLVDPVERLELSCAGGVVLEQDTILALCFVGELVPGAAESLDGFGDRPHTGMELCRIGCILVEFVQSSFQNGSGRSLAA